MEYKALSRGEGTSSGFKKRAIKKIVRAKPKLVRRPSRERPASQLAWGAVYLDATEFSEFEKCIQKPQKPTQSILEGAELIRTLYRKNR
jgi:hypothetical protein